MYSDNTQMWLKTGSAMVIGFGLSIAVAAHSALAAPVHLLADLIFWPYDGAQSIASPESRLLLAICGGVMVGWGVLLWLVATRLYPKDAALARMMVLWSVGIWFVIDSAASIIAGAPIIALLNMSFLEIFCLPLRNAARLSGTTA